MKLIKQIQIALIILFVLCHIKSNAQNPNKNEDIKQKITLIDVITIASKNSLDAFKAKQQYGASYWQFRSFRASVLPKINFAVEPLTYNKSVLKRYDSENNIDVYRPQQNLYSFGNLSISQIVKATGATVFANSSFSRLANFGVIDSKDFAATPISIGLIQPIMAFNPHKWGHKIAPLQFEYAKKLYIYEVQDITLKAVFYFFKWASASKRVELDQENVLSTQKLFKIGKKRYELGSIEKDDVLNLELDVYNAETSLLQNERELEKTESELRLFLRNDSPLSSLPELPELISELQIDIKEATALAEVNNPEIFNLKIKVIESERDLDKVIKENRFDLSLTGSYGLNQNANTVKDAYSNLLEQRMVSIQLSIPIMDWGERKGNIKTAKMNNQVSEIATQQERDKLTQQLALKIIDFNLQKQLVTGALRTCELAKSSYDIAEKRFLSGSIDLLRLTSARKAWQAAMENYIEALQNYWMLYYNVQQLTLFDFIKNAPLIQDFETILED
ncbi:TolC family protein [Flavobacterium sp. LHD-85]|uniref:TolC family protein n=1 Tax=Flavobacterium sp. LHD-85 TaxID=3071410 RepID=UPI0027DEB9BC|nr:TolC family protein [Flavobacterium sp. LHD-85]MDQ6527678.1 TolC family protein [Flavobacterium sp. LHD-85]